jgi:NADH:ubiquinone oxidoreductase subunit 4 (subunit M)
MRGAQVRDLRWGETLALLPLLILIVYLGIVPGVITKRLQQSVTTLPTIQSAAAHTSGAARIETEGATFVLRL